MKLKTSTDQILIIIKLLFMLQVLSITDDSYI